MKKKFTLLLSALLFFAITFPKVINAQSPSCTINQAVGQVDPTNSGTINFTAVFDQAVTGFTSADVTLTGTAGVAGATKTITGGPGTYNVAVSGVTGNGTVIATIPAGGCMNTASELNMASTSTDNTVTRDIVQPSVTINQAAGQPDPTNASTISFTVVFNESINAATFTAADIVLTGLTGFISISGSGTTFTVTISGIAGNGTITATIPAGAVQDMAGNSNMASTAIDNSVTRDTFQPTVTINQAAAQPDPANLLPINFTVVFSESVTGFTFSDVSLTGTAGGIGIATKTITGGPFTYNVAISGLTSGGTVIATIPAGGVMDLASNSNAASTSTDNTVTLICVTPATPTITAGGSTTFCAGGSVTLSSSASSGNQWYLNGGIIAGAGNQTFVATATGNYSVTISSCTSASSAPLTVTVNPSPTSTSSQINPSCFGLCNGSATVTPTGGTPGYTYSWAPVSGTSGTVTGLCAGTYTCTITDANGCIKTQAVSITQPAPVTATVTQTNISCFGLCNGTATVIPSGGTPGYTYSWTPTSQVSATATGLCAGTYTCVITDANGCITTQTVAITQPPVLTSTVSKTDAVCFGLCNGTAIITPGGGTPGYTYSWSPSGGTGSTATGLCAGSYTCTITDANGCIKTQTVTITQPTAITLTVTQTNVSCNGICNGTATINVSGGTPGYSYMWSPSGSTSATVTGLCAGSYTCTVTDANACTNTQSVIISEPTAITVTLSQTNVTCNGMCNGSIIAIPTGGTPGYTYSWTPGGGTTATLTGLCAGTYTCIITDANGCTKTQSTTITQPSAIISTTSQTNVSCNGGCNGTATITAAGGTPGYTYSWTPSGGTGSTASGLCSGTYTCTITDVNGCMATNTVTITEPPVISATISQTNITCNGVCNGTATVTASGGTQGYTYLWSPFGGTSSTATGLCAGTYTCIITDANGCTGTQTVTIIEPSAITVTTSQTNVTCNGLCNGTASITVSGGTAPYFVQWSPGSTMGFTATGLCAGTYIYTVTDVNGCTATGTVIITEPAPLTLTVSQSNVTCYGACDGTGTLNYSGGTAPYTFIWVPGLITTPSLTNLCAGTYTCNVTDANGCETTITLTISEPPILFANASSSAIACNGGTSNVNISATGGTIPYSGTGTFTISSGPYSYTVTDNNGCTATTSGVISEPNVITTTQTFAKCNGETVTVGSNVYSTTGIYTDVFTAANGCDSTVITDLTVTTPDVTVTYMIPTCPCPGYIHLDSAATSYQWIDCNNGNALITGETGQDFWVYTSGNYAVIVTENTCIDTSDCYYALATDITEFVSADFKLYPNPNHGTFVIKADKECVYTIINELGQHIRTVELNSNNSFTISISDLNNGVYFMVGINNDKVTRQKIIVTK